MKVLHPAVDRLAAIMTVFLGDDGPLVNRLIETDHDPRELVAASLGFIEAFLNALAQGDQEPSEVWQHLLLRLQGPRDEAPYRLPP